MRTYTLVFGFAGLAALAVAAAIAFMLFGLIAFGIDTRPWWSSAILISIMIVVPLGLSINLLFRAMDSLSVKKFRKTSSLLFCALLCPAFGSAIGLGMLSIRMLP